MEKESRILITGATGFIGSNLIKILIDKGYKNITCLVLPQDDIKSIEDYDINIKYGNIIEKETLIEIVKDKDIIIHLAAVVDSIGKRLNDSVNFIGTKNIVDVILETKTNIKRFFFASSIAASGPSKKGIYKSEKDREEPISLYGKSKLKAEKYLLSKKNELPITILRFPLVYGPGTIDGIYPLFKAIKLHLFPILPYNETNLCFVWDACSGIIDSINSNKTKGEIFYVGEREVYSSKVILKELKKIMNKFAIKIPMPSFILYFIVAIIQFFAKIFNKEPFLTKKNLDEYLKYRFWGVNTEKAIKYFNYKTKFPIEKGLKITLDWYRKNNYL